MIKTPISTELSTFYSEIISKMQSLSLPEYNHTAFINPEDGYHARKVALIRWLDGARQVEDSVYELPSDAVGRIYTVNVATGELIDKKKDCWSKGTREVSTEYTEKNGYLMFPHITFIRMSDNKKVHCRFPVHEIMAYVYPPLRDGYAEAAYIEMKSKGCTFEAVNAQVNHMAMNKNTNGICNLEITTASENQQHRHLYKQTTDGHPLSMVHRREDSLAKHLLGGYTTPAYTKSFICNMCHLLATVELTDDCVLIEATTHTGKRGYIDIADFTLWEVLIALYKAKTKSIVGCY